MATLRGDLSGDADNLASDDGRPAELGDVDEDEEEKEEEETPLEFGELA